METSELDESKRKLRSKRIEFRYYLSVAVLILAALALITGFLFVRINKAIDEIKADNYKTRKLVCDIVASIPNFPKNDSCATIRKGKDTTKSKGKSSNNIAQAPEPFDVQTFFKPTATTTAPVKSPPKAKTTVPVSTPEPPTPTCREVEISTLPVVGPVYRFVGTTLWTAGSPPDCI